MTRTPDVASTLSAVAAPPSHGREPERTPQGPGATAGAAPLAVPAPLARTALHALHLELGARVVPFAGYEMPVQYPGGILQEHLHTRAAAGLFDVSHMGQLELAGPGVDAALESSMPMDIVGLAPGQQRYALLTDASGGILDDLMVTRRDDRLLVVVNASCKAADTAHLRAALGLSADGSDEPASAWTLTELVDHALLALQGPLAEEPLDR